MGRKGRGAETSVDCRDTEPRLLRKEQLFESDSVSGRKNQQATFWPRRTQITWGITAPLRNATGG